MSTQFLRCCSSKFESLEVLLSTSADFESNSLACGPFLDAKTQHCDSGPTASRASSSAELLNCRKSSHVLPLSIFLQPPRRLSIRYRLENPHRHRHSHLHIYAPTKSFNTPQEVNSKSANEGFDVLMGT